MYDGIYVLERDYQGVYTTADQEAAEMEENQYYEEVVANAAD